MADISQYLQAILEAVYGEQVRGSIYNAIDTINRASEVSISAGTAVSEPSSSSTGFFVGSMYINTTTYDLWKCVGTDFWQRLGNIRGIGIASLEKTSTVGNVDYYTITFDDGETETFTVTNGINGINGSIWYKGTALTGTGTSITGFPGVQNDFYLNSSTGYVYVCTKTGGAMVPDAAEWDYVMTLTGGGGGSTIIVIDNLTSASSTDALSANQGRVLKNLVDQKVDSGSLAQVATSGSYSDLTNQPTIPTVDQTYSATSSNAQSGTAVAEAVDEFTTPSVAPVNGVVTFPDLNPDYGYDLYVDIPDETSSLPTNLTDLTICKWTKVQRSTKADGTITLAYTVTNINVNYCLRILK